MKRAVILLFILSFNILLFLTQTGVNAIAQEEGVTSPEFFQYKKTYMGEFETGNYTLDTNIEDKLPSSQAKVEPDTGNIFTDTFSTIKNWFIEKSGLGTVAAWFNAFPLFLEVIKLPREVSFALGFLWHGLMLFLIATLFIGK